LAFTVLDQLLDKDVAQAAVVLADWRKVAAIASPSEQPRYLAEVISGPMPPGVREIPSEPHSWVDKGPEPWELDLAEVRRLDPPQRHQRLLDWINGILADIIGVDRGDLNPGVPIDSLGMNSLMLLEFKNCVEGRTGVRLVTLFSPELTTTLLVDGILNLLERTHGSAKAATMGSRLATVLSQNPDEPLKKMDELSDAELEVLIQDLDALRQQAEEMWENPK
jgi:hypothetical protein